MRDPEHPLLFRDPGESETREGPEFEEARHSEEDEHQGQARNRGQPTNFRGRRGRELRVTHRANSHRYSG